ncbi:hypothetical protein PIROE2DRAFT_1404 [Piromyces sp. E2]|nr:hypothetical protein PIROE2DRAFT_1404 [Piromyces sp. E2]|eukprot:OUM70525.1 hypothetical protein PIROE2DRAFT_1404 [Piromyces sp. E2]
MRLQPGLMNIKGRNIKIEGTPPPLYYNDSVTYEDFDITARTHEIPLAHNNIWTDEKDMVRERHLDTNIPYINGSNPVTDYASLRSVQYYISKFLGDKVHPSVQMGAERFFEQIIVPNQQNLMVYNGTIPDLDCLYYKNVSGKQHLFLRLSSETRREAELYKKNANGKSLYAENGNIRIVSNNIHTDHIVVDANNISMEAKNYIFNRASKMKAKWVIRIKAGKQRNETVINKWVREERGSHHFIHQEGVESIDDCIFVAENVIQEGDEVENIGIFVQANLYEDRATHTSNMPAKITLYNYAWEEDNGPFSSAEASVKKLDDVLQPTRYYVNYYRSASSTSRSSVKYGYTLINSGSVIEVLKDIKEDVVVDERHIIEIHEEKNGFSFCGGVSVPDPTKLLSRLNNAIQYGNMLQLSTTALNAVAKGIQATHDCKVMKKLMDKGGSWGTTDSLAFLQVLTHYVNGPSIQFGSRSIDITQKATISHGNTVFAPYHIYHNKKSSSFAGVYKGKKIDIQTETMVTFDLPQTMESEFEMHQTGISMDLLSFAIMLMMPEAGPAMELALASSSVSVSFQSNKYRQVNHIPTVIQAEELNIEAKNGYLTQAQIKAGIVHAVFTNDLILKTLANEKWEHDFASIVGEKEFYLKVGNILRTESSFVGHKTHDSAHEHIETKEYQKVTVEECRESWDKSYDISVGAIVDALAFLKNEFFDEAMEEGLSPEKADKKANEKIKKIKENNTEEEIKQMKENKEKEKEKARNQRLKREDETKTKNEKSNKNVVNGKSEIDRNTKKIEINDTELNSKTKIESNKENGKGIVPGPKLKGKEKESIISDSQEGKNASQQDDLKEVMNDLKIKKEKYLKILNEKKASEKEYKANIELQAKKILLYHELDNQTDYTPHDILSKEEEANIRKNVEREVANKYDRCKKIVEAEYNARVRYHNGEGYEKLGDWVYYIDDYSVLDKIDYDKNNTDEKRLYRLRQEELTKIGESDSQNILKYLPLMEPVMEWRNGRMTGEELIGDLVMDLAETLAISTVLKPIKAFNASCEVFAKANKIHSGTFLPGKIIEKGLEIANSDITSNAKRMYSTYQYNSSVDQILVDVTGNKKVFSDLPQKQ